MPAELTLTLSRREPAVYAVRLRLRTETPGDDDDRSVDGTVSLDPDQLYQGWGDKDGRPAAENYGRALTAALFADQAVRDAWVAARARAGNPVRVRLELEEYALELHRVRWETLRDPVTDGPLLTDQNVWFSRYLHSFDMRRLRPPARAAARVLLAVAAPADLDGLRIGGRAFDARDRFDAPAEVAAVTAALAAWTPDVTPLPGPRHGPPTLKRIVDLLRTGTGFDVLYLVAHGGLHPTGPKLLLVDDAGAGAVVEAKDLVGELQRLRFPPRLVVLSSCQSAGPARPAAAGGPGGELDAALGPQLGRIGIPAVVAMLGNVLQPTANTFVRTFFEKLGPGQVDQAAAEARHAVQGALDHWAPVLYTRLTSGRLWRDPAAGTDKFDQWDGLIDQLRRQQCIPVLGSGLLERLVGSTHGLAERLPGALGWLAATGPADLPQAAQYVDVISGEQVLRAGYLEALAAEVREQFGPLAPADTLGPEAPPQAAAPMRRPAEDVRLRLAAAADRIAADHAPEAHDLLAGLGCPVYLSTNPDDLLGRALARVPGRRPTVRVCNWLYPEQGPPGAPPEGDDPTPERPVVYHLFGHLSQPYSVVLSEDDYFRFLIGISKAHEAQAFSQVNARLIESSLLFLGFRLDDWDFRAFLRFFMSHEAAVARRGFDVKDVAVQLDPDDGRNANPDRVRRYLEQLFRDSRISIYWGSTQEFLEELDRRWRATP